MSTRDFDRPQRFDSTERLAAECREVEAFMAEGPLPQSAQSYLTHYKRLEQAEQALEQKTNALLAKSHALQTSLSQNAPLRQAQHELTLGLMDLHYAARDIASHARTSINLELMDRVTAHRQGVLHKAPAPSSLQQRDLIQTLKARSAIRTLPRPIPEARQEPINGPELKRPSRQETFMADDKRPTLTVRHLYGGFKTFKTERALEAALKPRTEKHSLVETLREASEEREKSATVKHEQDTERDR